MSPVLLVALVYLAFGAIIAVKVFMSFAVDALALKWRVTDAEERNRLSELLEEQQERWLGFGQARVVELVQNIRLARALSSTMIMIRFYLRQIDEDKLAPQYRSNPHTWSTAHIIAMHTILHVLGWPIIIWKDVRKALQKGA